MKREDIDQIFHPRSIAVVGASDDMNRGATMFLHCLLEMGYGGELYPVNPTVERCLGIQAYPSLLALPGVVDHVIVGVPARITPSIVQEAVQKQARSVHLFTSGFAEVATPEGLALQERITEIARGRVRIIGPNCMGIYHPKMRMAFAGGLAPAAGSAGFVSQSGGMAIAFSDVAGKEGNYCSKVVSIGNSSDLKLADFLEYFGEDAETETISMYVEGVPRGEGRRFLDALGAAAEKKPVVIWKAGQTDAGARAAASHTGSMAGGYRIWQAIARQFGAILVESIEEMHDFIKLHRMVPLLAGKRACLLTFGGGNSVAYADVCAREGVELPELRWETQEALLQFIPPMGTIRKNPVDVSAAGWEPNVIENTARVAAQDPNVDCILFVAQMGFLANMAGRQDIDPQTVIDHQVRGLASAVRDTNVPILCNNPLPVEDLAAEELRLHFKKALDKNGIPSFPTMERTSRALRRYLDHAQFVRAKETPGREGPGPPPLSLLLAPRGKGGADQQGQSARESRRLEETSNGENHMGEERIVL